MIKFIIPYPNYTPYHIEVLLFDSIGQLRKRVRSKDLDAMYRPNGIVIYPKRIVRPKLGTIYIAKDSLGAGIVAHEVFHASMDYAHKRFNVGSLRTENGKRQEEVAYFHGYIVKEIWNKILQNSKEGGR